MVKVDVWTLFLDLAFLSVLYDLLFNLSYLTLTVNAIITSIGVIQLLVFERLRYSLFHQIE